MISPRILFFLLGILLCAALVMLAFHAAGPQELESPAVVDLKKGGSSQSTGNVSLRNSPGENDSPKTNSSPRLPTEAPKDKESILEAIQDASTTYNPAHLPKIQPYLLHPDPEIREAAVNGIVNLGDAAGSPLLRAAAKQTSSPHEAVHLLEMADYLELPSANLLNVSDKGSAGAEPSTSGK